VRRIHTSLGCATCYTLLNKEKLGLSPKVRDEALPAEEAKHILSKLRDQRFGTKIHTILELVYNTGLRLGGLAALDLNDLDKDDNDLYVRHRPGEGTRLKNGNDSDDQSGNSERVNTIKPAVVEALDGYIKINRPDVTDEYGRKPMFATQSGRADTSTLRRWIYEATHCRWAEGGPDDIICDGSCDPDSDVCPHSYCPPLVIALADDFS
jgi:integrase